MKENRHLDFMTILNIFVKSGQNLIIKPKLYGNLIGQCRVRRIRILKRLVEEIILKGRL